MRRSTRQQNAMQRIARPLIVLAATMILQATATQSHAEDVKACWQPDALRAKPGDATIRQGLKEAFVPIPAHTPQRQAAVPPALRGAIRRIDLPAGDKRIALTFDLCEQPYEISGYQGDIVDYLRQENIPATFFAGGKWLLTHSLRATQLMADHRFEIANHSWEHRNHRLISGKTLANAIDGAQAAYEITRARLKASACVNPTRQRLAFSHVPQHQRLFRFPFGACNQAALDAVNDRGLLAIQWDVSSADPWRGMTADAMVKHVLARTRPGSILLFHANGRGWNTASALPRIIAALRAKGYTFDSVSRMLATKGAKPVITPTCYDERPGDSERYDDLGRKLIKRYDEFYAKVGRQAARAQ